MWQRFAGDNGMNKTDKFTVENPREIHYWNVMFWEPESQELIRLKKNGDKMAATMLTKAETFLMNKCIQKTSDGFLCKPLEGYNKTTYSIKVNPFSCNCQGFCSKVKKGEPGNCSHILAVKQFIFIEGYNEYFPKGSLIK